MDTRTQKLAKGRKSMSPSCRGAVPRTVRPGAATGLVKILEFLMSLPAYPSPHTIWASSSVTPANSSVSHRASFRGKGVC